MKYLTLPKNLLKFWYPESLVVSARIWKNVLFYLEEDLAVKLMLRLLLVPLFHDSTVVGRLISIAFRLSRVGIGLFAMALSTLLVASLALIWFALPALAFILGGNFGLAAKALLFSGVVLFINHLLAHPPKKSWQVQNFAEVWRCSFLKPKEVDFAGLMPRPEIKNLLLYLELTPAQIAPLLGLVALPEVEKRALEVGKSLKVPYLGAEHFFVVMLSLMPNIDSSLIKLGLKISDFFDVLDYLQKKANLWRVVAIWDEDFAVKHLRGVNRGWLSVPTPNLDLVTEDLTKKAGREYIPDFVGRPEVVSKVINILSLEKGRNVVIVGEPGAGRTELVEYLAKLIVTGDAPAALATRRIVRLDLTGLLSGVKTQGELAEKVKAVFEEVQFCGNIIIFVDEIHELGIGEAGSSFNLYSLLLPFLESDQFQFVSVTEPKNYLRILEKNGSLARLFAKIDLPPASVKDTIEILKERAIQYERSKKVRLSLPAVTELARLAERHIHGVVLPDSALHLFEECLPEAQNGWITRQVVEKVIQSAVAVPIGEASPETKLQLLNLETIIHQKMIDQEEAVSAVANVLRRAGAGLRDTQRPIGSFLFVGPTGVGKTELAKILAETYFKGKGNFFRLDMSEYQNPEAVQRLIGNEQSDGTLLETVENKPYSLILLDEFEKADQRVLTIFLQVLDDGRLTGASGKTADFTNTIIIATSNAASLTIARGLESGQNLPALEGMVKEELLRIFKPELVNRFDGVVLFKPLSETDLQKIVRLKLLGLQNQLKEQGYLVDFEEGLVQKLAQRGYDPVLGARPLRRLIQDTLEARFSTLILEGRLPKGQPFRAGEALLSS